MKMKYHSPIDSTLFLLRDVLGFDNELTEPILTEAAKLCEEEIAPTNQIGDKEGCVRVPKVTILNEDKTIKETRESFVRVPECFKEPYKKFAEGGWLGLSVPEEYGGQGLPYTLAAAVNEFVSSSNMAFSMFPGLTRGAIQALLASGNDFQKHEYIPRLVSGEWTGTMCLTEPHCGTDLGLLKTKAVHDYDDWYKITGQKIFISGGDHDLTDNILHLVLARVEGDSEGVKGISLFAVPKNLGENNNVSCGSIEEKMGIHGSPTCVMNFDGAYGILIGERCKGLQAMFVMMNEARLGVAVQGLSQSELAYQNALEYAKERLQGTKLSNRLGETTTRNPCSIIHHPDVRRMLLDVRSINEAARLLILEAAMLVDKADEESQDRLGLMTPVLKGVLTDYGFENAVKMQQVWGGHGYVRDNGMEQIVRDARIAMIYEGANGIQALDLVGRKLPKNMGRAITKFFKDSESFLSGAYDKDINPIVQPMTRALNELKQATEWLMHNAIKNPNNAGSASYDYMKMMGLVMLGMAHIKICLKTNDKTRHDNATYFMERIVPETSFLLKRIKEGSDTMMKAEF
jgi:alkylation response protein AidB-like acyl-CoA dehydrogenase